MYSKHAVICLSYNKSKAQLAKWIYHIGLEQQNRRFGNLGAIKQLKCLEFIIWVSIYPMRDGIIST